MDEGAKLSIYDPKVVESQIFLELKHPFVSARPERVDTLIEVHKDAYRASSGAHAIVVCTEWDEFADLDYQRIYEGMKKPGSASMY